MARQRITSRIAGKLARLRPRLPAGIAARCARRTAGWSRRRKRFAGLGLVVLTVAVLAGSMWMFRGVFAGDGRGARTAPPADAGRAETDTVPVLPVVATPAPRPTRLVSFDEGCVTAECHAGLASSPVVHSPVAVGACSECHAPDSGGHVYPVTRSPKELCTTCHEPVHSLDAPFATLDTPLRSQDGPPKFYGHAASSDQACLACHDPHASNTHALMTKPTLVATCATCHPAAEKVSEAAAAPVAPASDGARPAGLRDGGPSVHPPFAAGDCNACHSPHGADNPRLLVGGGGDAHCAQCHPKLVFAMHSKSSTKDAPALYTHGGIDGGCNACHAPHSSDRPGLLTAEPRALCISCHEQVGREVEGAIVSHDAVLKGQQCVSCHEPHASNNAMMLRDDQRPVCLSCHDKAVIARDGRTIPEMASVINRSPVVHGPAKAGDCGECHAVHGGEHAWLLRKIPPDTLPRAYDERNFAMCFSCHDRELLAENTLATAFRDGTRNMHRIHVVSDTKSRGCGTCHSVHASQQPMLIADNVAFEGSGWMMPLNFVVEPEGGSCSPGCHEPMRYRRTITPAPAPPAGGAPKKGGGP